jgi:hypothetical protein
LAVISALDLAIAFRGNDDRGAAFGNPLGEMVRVIAFVGDGGFGVDAVDQIMGKGDVVALARRADQANRQTERLGGGVDLGAQAAARPAQALGIRPPLTLRAPAAC